MFKVSNIVIKLLDNVLAKEWLALYLSLGVDPDFILDSAVAGHMARTSFQETVKQANREFNFNWPLNPTTQEELNAMHKDIETAPGIDAHKFRIIHDQLHSKEIHNGTGQYQIGWADSLGKFYRKKDIKKKIPDHANNFSKKIKRGDVFLGFPHVGKSPVLCMEQKETENLRQTCRLHDTICLDIAIAKNDAVCDTDRKLSDWFDQNKITFFTKEKMLKYNGWGKIGEVVNKDTIDNMDTTNLKTSYHEQD
jgi:hypothetical protein